MEYICETSHGDQKIGCALSGWENPQFQVFSPSLASLVTVKHGVDVPAFVSKLFEFCLARLEKRSFAEALAASRLMYLPDTLTVCPNHSLHLTMVASAKAVLPYEDDTEILNILKHWGEKVRLKFIMDNLMQLKTGTILENLNEEGITQRFVGAHTFAEVLNKLVGGYRGLMNEILELRGIVSDIAAANSRQTTLLENLVAISKNSQATGADPSNSCDASRTFSQFRQARNWPRSLNSLANITMSQLLFMYLADSLDEIPHEPITKYN
ncbi:hypothetical protein AC1031_016541 [Aphanomyces cochlioides]|nr:hypothetical protein AC1031_016541 [Aphanomyces cochlioides]